ncbi:VOC family protein [Streptomyces sp. NPDC054838]
MTVTSVVLRRQVDDLEQALPCCEKLTGRTPARFAGVSATLGVAGLDAVVATGVDAGAELIGAPADISNGRRSVLRHPDGAVYEYVGS